VTEFQNGREAYEVIVKGGKLVYKQSGELLETSGDSKWIFVLSTSATLYVGRKRVGCFQHSSFLAGAATIFAGRLVAHAGVLEVNACNDSQLFCNIMKPSCFLFS